jgi:hypothetical protein
MCTISYSIPTSLVIAVLFLMDMIWHLMDLSMFFALF